MIMARLLFIFWALSGAQAFGSETEQQRQAALWLSEYQTNWYPSAQIRAQTKQYIDATFTGTNYQTLQFLPAKESKHLLLASLLYLRATSYLEYTENLTDYAQLAIELPQRQQHPIAQSEGHYFYAYDL